MVVTPFTQKQRPSRGRLLDSALRTAIDYIDHHKYDSVEVAVRSLRRRCRGFTPRQYRTALRKAIHLLDNVEAVIAPFDPPYDTLRSWPGFPDATRALRERCPGFLMSTYRLAISWVLFWRHWK